MSEYESRERGRGRDHDVSYTQVSTSHASYTPAPRTPAEQASDEITYAARGVNLIAGSLEGLRQAHAANDPARWHEARGLVDRHIATAEKDLEKARARTHDAEPAAREQLAAAEAALAQHVAAANLMEAPRGWKPVAREAEILAILHTPEDGAARNVFAQKEAQLKAELARLSSAESHHLAARLNKTIADDPVAAAIARFVPERKARIVAFLGDARRRSALIKTNPGATTLGSTTSPNDGRAAAGSSSCAAPTTHKPGPEDAASAEPVSFEMQVRHLIDATAPDLDTLAAIDGTRRHAMARRLESYRLGNGDPLGARFVRLDRKVRQRLLEALLGTEHDVSREQLAAQAIEYAAAPLPFVDQIQKSFGRHDVSAVRVATDADAVTATTALGARAFALGNRVALSHAVDLHTVAHEAAHTIQQRGHLAGDAEAHADAVADLVVRGESAEHLLDQVSGSRAAPRLQLKSESAPTHTPAVAQTPADLIRQMNELAKPDVAWAYLRANEDNFVSTIARRLATFTPPISERVAWQPNGLSSRFRDALFASLGSERLWIHLPELLHPADPWRIIDEHRTIKDTAVVQGRDPTGPLVWNALAGDAVANEVVTRMHESMARMVPRYVAQVEAKQPRPVVVADLVTSHPFDRIVAELLCDDQVARPIAMAPGRRSKSAGAGDFRDGVQFLADYHWLGASDRALWNWIEVREPRDARAEDVAATLWLDPSASQRAYGITASPPFFRVEPSWARMFDDAKRYAPAGLDQAHGDNALALASSSLATEAAIAQAVGDRTIDKHVPMRADLVHMRSVLDQSYRQLERMRDQLAPWKLSETLRPTVQWVAAQRAQLPASAADRQLELVPVIDGQQEILFEVAGAIAELATTLGGAAGLDGNEGDVTNVLRAYATVAGESHLVRTARTALARARASKGWLALDLLERSAGETRNAIAEVRGSEVLIEMGGVEAETALAVEQRRIVALRRKQADGQAIDADEVALIAAELKEQAVDSRTKSWYLNLHNLINEARDSRFGYFETLASAFSSDLRSLPDVLFGLTASLQLDVIKPYHDARTVKLREAGDDKQARARALQEVARDADARLEAFVEDNQLQSKFGGWSKLVQHQQTRTAVIKIATQIAILIGTSVVGGFAGNMVSSAVRGAFLAEAADATVGMLRVARVVGTVGGLATDAAVNATVQTAIGGGTFGDAFIDNFLANGAIRAALAPLHAFAEAYGGAEKELRNLSVWERGLARGTAVIRAGVVLTADMITAAAVDYVIHRIRTGEKPDDKTAMEWAIQGGSMAIGSFVGKWLHGFEARAATLVEHGAHLVRRGPRIRALAARVERTGNKDAALELLIQRKDALDEEAATIHDLLATGKITEQIASTLEAGNGSERDAVKKTSLATMPLRLTRLTPDDASGKVWTGTSEDIAIALHQAHRAGLSIDVLDHDVAAREWKVRYNGEELTILETELVGQPRAAKTTVDDADRVHARRYAEAADFLQERWEARIKTDLDQRAVIEVDHLQTGYAFGGVVNQATLPATGEALGAKLVVYAHKGTLSSRGEQELGQGPDKFDAPGVRATEQAPAGTPWLKSKHLDRALDVGRFETQTPAYRGTAVDLQVRPKGMVPEDWAAPSRTYRVKIRDVEGSERWFYCDRWDSLGGLGPASLKSTEGVIDPQYLDGMLATNAVLRGDDPSYAAKVKAGRVLVWGGSPSGAWAAEPTIHPAGSEVTVLGDTRPPSDWPTLLRDYEDINREIAAHPGEAVPEEMIARKAEIERSIAEAHSGMTVPRNRKPGATYAKPITHRDPGDVKIEFGTPSKIAPTSDGRVIVTVGVGENARSTIYDQIVIAHGQDPGAPGGPGGLLGPKAKGASDDVPAGTIALRPIYGPRHAGHEPEILGLESIDPPGIQLKGAAFASKRMSGWVEKSERERFVRAVDAMSAEHARTRDHGEISEDSRGVSPGMEVQRDRIPRANEVLAAKAYRLPGPDHTLELDPDHRERWDDEVREFFTVNLRATAKWVRVQRLGGGKSGAVVYHVWVDDNDVGVFKLFDHGGATREREMLDLLAKAKLEHMTPVHARGQIGINAKSGFDGALLMDTAKGSSIKELIEALPSDPTLHVKAVQQLEAAVARVAVGLAELHQKFRSGEMMSNDAKRSDADHLLNRNFRDNGENLQKVRGALGDDFERVKTQLEGPTLDAFYAANVPATAYHGDANAGNFIVGEYKGGYKDLGLIDVGSMSWSVADGTTVGTRTGAADVARFLGSLESLAPGKLSEAEIVALRARFARAYFAQPGARGIDQSAYAAAEKWYRIEMEVAALRTDTTAKARILRMLGIGEVR